MQFNSGFLHFSRAALCLLVSFIPSLAQTPPANQPAANQPAANQPPANQPGPTRPRPPANFVNPTDVNVALGSDPRLFAVMAALNLAGYNYEPGGAPLGEVRARLRNELEPQVEQLDPNLLKRLRDFYASHRRGNTDEPAQAAPYVALAFALEDPPSLALAVPEKALPEDVAAVAGFAPLVGELFRRAKLPELIPKYAPAFNTVAATYYQPVGEMIFQVLSYLHTTPVTFIPTPAAAAPERSEKKDQKEKGDRPRPTPETRRALGGRVRRMFVITDPLSARDTVFVRNDLINLLGLKDRFEIKVGDDYIVVVGPSNRPDLREIRRSFIRFVLDPIIERYAAELFDPKTKQRTGLAQNIAKLADEVKTATPQLKDNITLVIRESLVYAVEAGLARSANRSPQERAAVDEDNLYNLSRQYDRGAVLAFHFYEKLRGLEEAGINVTDLYPEFLRTIKFDVEGTRAQGFEALRAKVEARRAAERGQAALLLPGLDPRTAANLDQADSLIQQRQFGPAQAALKQVLASHPQNARALYGLALITSQQPSAVEQDPKAEDDDKFNAQEERLGQAVLLYRQAIEAATSEQELWIKSRSHVAIGRIFDFADKREAALAEYEAAVKLGDVKDGAYQEALEGKARPFQPKKN